MQLSSLQVKPRMHRLPFQIQTASQIRLWSRLTRPENFPTVDIKVTARSYVEGGKRGWW